MRVGLFVTCLADVMRPSIGLAALDLLEQLITPGIELRPKSSQRKLSQSSPTSIMS
jgi:hypothetical protein